MSHEPTSFVTAASHGGPELTVVVPTFNERENIEEVVMRLHRALSGVEWELIFVDDNSPDGTADKVRELAQKDHRIRVVHRVGRRGLSTACIEGMMASSSPYLAVMDADLQHDETLLPEMLAALKRENLDIVVGSRYVGGGSTGEWASDRKQASRFATKLSKLVLKVSLEDPMSGFFMLRRGVIHEAINNLSGIGFKILLDIFVSAPVPLKFKELPYEFRTRHAGVSKLDSMVAWEYLMMLLDKMVGRFVPVRFLLFGFIGVLGVGVHMAVLSVGFLAMQTSFLVAQTTATLVAMTSNFLLNNALTYRDRRLKGWGLLKGWVSFSIACSIGAASNVGVAAYLFQESHIGWAGSAIAGVVVGAVWNYAVTAVYTWNKPKPT